MAPKNTPESNEADGAPGADLRYVRFWPSEEESLELRLADARREFRRAQTWVFAGVAPTALLPVGIALFMGREDVAGLFVGLGLVVALLRLRRARQTLRDCEQQRLELGSH